MMGKFTWSMLAAVVLAGVALGALFTWLWRGADPQREERRRARRVKP
jgi:hypothetical protein